MLTDKLGKNADSLRRKKLFLLDMDGTIYNENRLFDGTLDFLRQIEENGGRYIFITNNSSKSVEDYIQKVNAMGIPADASHFYTSSQATAFYLKEYYPGQKVYCMGTRSLVKELQNSGITVVTEVDEEASVVLIGFDTENTSEKLRDTCIMLGKNVAYLATNPDLVCPVSFGYIPDCGSMSIMLKNATRKTPFFIGKPAPIMVECVLKKLSASPEETLIIGDRLYTDIATGKNAGVDTVCVLSGEATLTDIETGSVKPTWIFDDIKHLYQELEKSKISKRQDYTLRLAGEQDAAALLAIYASYVENTVITFEYEVPSVEEFTRRIRDTLSFYPWLVCEKEGEIVGYAYAHRHKERAAYQWGCELSVYLKDTAIGQGIGTALYQALIRILALQNVYNLYACVTMPNEKSERLHAALGFSSAGVWHHSGYKHGAWHDVAWYEKIVCPHPAAADAPDGSAKLSELPPDPLLSIHEVDPKMLDAILSAPSSGR